MSSVLAFFKMGGYAAYVWPAYVIAAGIFMGQLLHLKRQKKRVARKLQAWFDKG